VIICSGKVAFDIEAKLEKSGVPATLIKVEEIAPFPVKSIKKHLAELGNDTTVTWVQEEALN
jgi:2-oxoglutarate dehydrogenase complex dehydrogenase (E1) component-like enzyme